MKHKVKIVIGIAIVIVTVLVIIQLKTGVWNSDQKLLGANGNTFFYMQEIDAKGYQTLEDGLNAKDENLESEQKVCQVENEGVVQIFLQGKDVIVNKKGEVLQNSPYIICYEFMKEGNIYYYSGQRKLSEGFLEDTHNYTWQETFLADLSISQRTTYKKMVGNRYEVLPAWGLSENPEIGNVTADGQKIDEVHTVEMDGAEYYLWIIYDLETENNASDILVEED